MYFCHTYEEKHELIPQNVWGMKDIGKCLKTTHRKMIHKGDNGIWYLST